jgi:hypothetical protein
MALVVLVLALAALGAAAVRWGADTRDGLDWQRRDHLAPVARWPR